MKIAFLNGSLEPGRDGVGDYTRSLAQECVRQGHSCCLIALNDRWITEPERAEEDGLTPLRLPAALDWTERLRRAGEMLDDFGPDWISLQFVPYAFHPKGIVSGLAAKLAPLTRRAKLHIMFHELWIGEYVVASAKDRLIGEIQRRFVLRLLQQIKPRMVHTSNFTYIARLSACGVSAKMLPLFGNVEIAAQNGDGWLFPLIREAGLNITSANRSKFWLFGFFGGLYSNWPSEPLFSRLKEIAQQQGRQVIILSIGRLGASEPIWERCAAVYASDFTFLKFGEHSQNVVSQYLQSLDFGLATTPYCAIGKSGTVAAMLDHGLPVIVNREERQWIMDAEGTPNEEPLLIRLKDGLQELKAGLPRGPAQSRLPAVAGKFLSDLGCAENANYV